MKKYYYFIGFLALLINFSLILSATATIGWVVEGANIYVAVLDGDIPTATLSASPNPCSIPQGQTICSSTITWNTTNAPNACVFAKETKQLFACSTSGNQSASGITEQGSTFEVHLTNDINSQLLASLLVKGIKQQTVQHTLNVSKSGSGNGTITAQGVNCGSDCSEIYNQGTSVTLTAIPDSNSLFSNWQGDCSGTNDTCALTMNSNKSVIAVFNKKPTDPVVCSTGSIRACIDSIIPNPANNGQTITFTGHGEADNNKLIQRYRWRLDSIGGRTRICKQGEAPACQFDSSSLSLGTHTIYFRVSVGRIFGGWSDWISKEFTVGTTTPTCGNNICESGENSGNCLNDCPVPPPPPPPTNIPAAPSNVKAQKSQSPFGYLITWQDNSNNETLFEIGRKIENGDWNYRGSVGGNVTKYIDTSTNSVMNTFRVRACNKRDCSVYVESNPIDLFP